MKKLKSWAGNVAWMNGSSPLTMKSLIKKTQGKRCRDTFYPQSRVNDVLAFGTYYEAQIADESPCQGCGICEERCPVQAIVVQDGRSRLNTAKCIGCGQCELQCPEGVIRMIPKERMVMLPLQKRSEARIAWQV